VNQHSASYGLQNATPHHADEQEPNYSCNNPIDDITTSSLPMDAGMPPRSKPALRLTEIADPYGVPLLSSMCLVTMNALGRCIDLHTDQGYFLGYGGAQASMMDEDVFPFEQDWLTEGMPNPPMDVQYFGGSPQIAPVHNIDTELLKSPLDSSPPFVSTTDPISIQSQGDPTLMMTPSLTPSSPFSFPLTASLASEGASPLSPLGLRGSPFSPFGEASIERLLKQGYPGDSPTARERCKVLRHAMFNETNQLPTCAREIKKLADIQRLTDDTPEDALPSSAPGKKSPTLVLQCAWAGCEHSCSRPDRLKTHVFTHIGFKPFPCDRSCGDPHW